MSEREREREREGERERERERWLAGGKMRMETAIKEGRREEGRQRVKTKRVSRHAELSVLVQALTYLFRVILYIVCGLCCECGVMVVGGAFSRSKR